MTILDEIIAQKRIEVAQRKEATSISDLEQLPDFKRQCLSARDAIQDLRSTGIIAEFKRKSPSKGIINGKADVTETTQGYVRAGAAVLSVLTDEPFFGGTPADLMAARLANPGTPILRKDFVIDRYQLLEAKAWGADLVLLIAACLTAEEVAELSLQAHDLSMQVLLEVHDEEELDRCLNHDIDLVGVNNRNLKTFTTSVDTSLRLVERIPDTFAKITESGLHDAETMLTLFRAGFDGFLIGEAFMKTADPAAALQTLVTDFTSRMPTFINSYNS
ncbi:indole-3-glycerol phosphate synthase TrpC [Spirosoma sp. KCTC 42546]|uniref:indole-3-glycerol phosphate synthase TrpC n=1 Tax=Spirosoma sp. KCTC 42546 TaxID=2520506 RepID=UPI00115C12DC|nr:indole-3-glycerol phosphate synthase TrpC [Spirosoma sp. KCTC 42546]QDK83532.1 indole-3-glycerol phosphate synthase TrpC [Spirosoma sp. KCTC 42546]